MGDVILFVDDLSSNSSISVCRICHEEEYESFKSLEAPCACSGTVKEYEPGYTVTVASISKKSQLIEAAVTIRDSLQIPRTEVESQHQRLLALDEGMNVENEFYQCTSAADRGASCCRSLALTFAVVLLVKHLFAVLNGETDHYPFALLTILFCRATGILLPMYILVRTITVFRNRMRRQYHDSDEDTSNSDDEDDVDHQELHNV